MHVKIGILKVLIMCSYCRPWRCQIL